MNLLDGAATMETVTNFLKKLKTEITIWSSNPTPEYLSEENEITILRLLYPRVLSSITYNNQDMRTT